MAKNAKTVNAKREAYAKQQEKEGNNVVMWIIGVLILLGIVYAGWSIFMVS